MNASVCSHFGALSKEGRLLGKTAISSAIRKQHQKMLMSYESFLLILFRGYPNSLIIEVFQDIWRNNWEVWTHTDLKKKLYRDYWQINLELSDDVILLNVNHNPKSRRELLKHEHVSCFSNSSSIKCAMEFLEQEIKRPASKFERHHCLFEGFLHIVLLQRSRFSYGTNVLVFTVFWRVARQLQKLGPQSH